MVEKIRKFLSWVGFHKISWAKDWACSAYSELRMQVLDQQLWAATSLKANKIL